VKRKRLSRSSGGKEKKPQVNEIWQVQKDKGNVTAKLFYSAAIAAQLTERFEKNFR